DALLVCHLAVTGLEASRRVADDADEIADRDARRNPAGRIAAPHALDFTRAASANRHGAALTGGVDHAAMPDRAGWRIAPRAAALAPSLALVAAAFAALVARAPDFLAGLGIEPHDLRTLAQHQLLGAFLVLHDQRRRPVATNARGAPRDLAVGLV